MIVGCLLGVTLGIDLNSAQLLIETHKKGVSFKRMATLGRQRLLGDRHELVSILRKSAIDLNKESVSRLLDPTREFAEDFLGLLGAKDILAIDVSDFEGAQILHDMNQPLPANLIGAFDLVLDGGTLEHIFDLPTALKNTVKMVNRTGRFISLTQANNFCGHGFYQFSPELYYRFLCPQNGFRMEECIVWEDIPKSKFYRVPDPDKVRSRINLTSRFGTYMFIAAERVGDQPTDFVPQQSDYARMWEEFLDGKIPYAQESPSGRLHTIRSFLKRIPSIRTAVVSARKLAGVPTRRAVKEYRDLQIKNNTSGFLVPVQDLRVVR